MTLLLHVKLPSQRLCFTGVNLHHLNAWLLAPATAGQGALLEHLKTEFSQAQTRVESEAMPTPLCQRLKQAAVGWS